MALGDNTTSVARGNDGRGRKPYLIQAMTGTTTGGVIRMFAVCMDVDDTGDMTAQEVDRDTLA